MTGELVTPVRSIRHRSSEEEEEEESSYRVSCLRKPSAELFTYYWTNEKEETGVLQSLAALYFLLLMACLSLHITPLVDHTSSRSLLSFSEY